MRITVFLALALSVMAAFGGCSSAQINETADSIGSDIKNFGEKVTEQH
ncbi:hypothetical protein LOH54_02850 [Sulfurimonas sp. HSL-3221]|uniref:Entericidin A/B family lipoprotein n=1 Tax=Sulfurimonas diazotrophicus TaxID=3131939 RepID=A0ABZ3HD55_9BACT|nr:hypothetical protein [Sulfurimonas sp. HSL-3221]UFS63073.1 hypothetical protein LOH54_02850 [Sulfurimonas sp. HSL-3221]